MTSRLDGCSESRDRDGSWQETAEPSSGGTSNSICGSKSEVMLQAGHIRSIYVGSAQRTHRRKPERSIWYRLKRLFIIIAVTVFAVVVSRVVATPADPEAVMPGESGDRPPDAHESIILTAVKDSIVSCAKAVVLQPVNCPQASDNPNTPPMGVQWSLHGDPVGGARLVWHNDRFHVAGYAVLTVKYLHEGQWAHQVYAVPYRAEATWARGRATIVGLRTFSTIDRQSIKKKNPEIQWSQIEPVLRNSFQRCGATTHSPMPAGCPYSITTPALDAARWTFDADPLLNAKYSFDEATGLVHVWGSYAAIVESLGGRFKGNVWSQAGNYRAIFIPESSGLRTLKIVHL
jgi:hypothetical protein